MLIAVLQACAPVLKGPLDTSMPETQEATLSHGYALLAGILHEESSASLILGIKHASEPVQVLLQDVSDAAARGHRDLLALTAGPPPITLDHTGLPLIEVNARNLLYNKEVPRLLLAGRSFEIRMLIAQEKACEYIEALAASLATADTDPARVALMHRLAGEFLALDTRARALIGQSRQDASNDSS